MNGGRMNILKKHELCDGVPALCDLCGREVEGVLLRCIHCPGGFCMCLSCSVTIGHETERKHICEIVF